jgi:UTP-glucose-1-phosphate uridylyltransferase
MEKAVAILAAGIGSRYGGVKQMEPVGPSGEFIIDYSVFDAIRAGFNKVVFIIRRDIETDFMDTIGRRIGEKIEVAYTYQELTDLPERTQYDPQRTKPWGTVQAALACDGMLNGPFAIINADDFYGRDSYATLSKYLDVMVSENVNACMVGFMLVNTLSKYGTVTRGICRSGDSDMLDSIVETPGIGSQDDRICFEDSSGNKVQLNADDLASMNMWGFTPDVLGLFKEQFRLFLQAHSQELKSEYVIPTAVNTLVEQGKVSVKVLGTTSDWFGITNPADKDDVVARIAELISSGQYPDDLWKGDVTVTACDSRRDA